MISDEKLSIFERFGDSDQQEMVKEIRIFRSLLKAISANVEDFNRHMGNTVPIENYLHG